MAHQTQSHSTDNGRLVAGDGARDTAVRGDVAARLPAPTKIVVAALRLVLGFYFLWAFLDKTFGLGFATPAENAWVNGGSPTTGFLGGVEGPFAGFFNGMAGAAWADWLFMLGLFGIGLALLLGIGMRIAATSGAVLLFLMYLAALPLTTNPIFDSHIVEALALILIAQLGAGSIYGLGAVWQRIPVVARNRWLI